MQHVIVIVIIIVICHLFVCSLVFVVRVSGFVGVFFPRMLLRGKNPGLSLFSRRKLMDFVWRKHRSLRASATSGQADFLHSA
jgi:hypothetical protein